MHVTWNNAVEDGAKHSDLVAFLACYDLNNWYDASTAAAARVDGAFHFQLGRYREAKFAYVYVTVLSDDRERAANSVYVGKIALT